MSSDESTTPVCFASISGIVGYRFGSDGSVWSCLKIGGRIFTPTDNWRKLRPSLDRKRGYYVVDLRQANPGRRLCCQVHRLILEAFVGPCPAGMEACHNNGIRTDNRISNLRWDTRSANRQDAIRHGTHRIGEAALTAKLTVADVLEIRRRHAEGEDQPTLAQFFGVNRPCISKIVTRQRWKHV